MTVQKPYSKVRPIIFLKPNPFGNRKERIRGYELKKINLCALGTIVLSLGLVLNGLAPAGEKEFSNSIGMRLVLIPAGEFLMGGDESPESVANNPAYSDKPIDVQFVLIE